MILGAVVLAVGVLARRVHVAAPILLLIAGAALGFVPLLREVELPPEVVLLLFLPALLYWESLTTSLREIRSNLRSVVLTSTLLVVLTAAVVAVVAHAVGLDWGAAWVLGAAVAPTDATATAALAGGMPRRTLTTLRAESLVNDGTALVILALAIGVSAHGMAITAVGVGGQLLLSYGGGIAIGVAVAWVATQVRKRMDDALEENVVSLLSPFTAYLVAEVVGASGVLAVVICGLAMSQIGPRIAGADTRTQMNAFWTLATYLLNGALFVLVGIELQVSVRDLRPGQLVVGLLGVAVVTVAVVAVRFGFFFGTGGVLRLLERTPERRAALMTNRMRLVMSTAGFRGAVSLAAALSVPRLVDGGDRFPDRALVVFVTAGVIAVTLVLQGLVLPLVLRRAQLPPDEAVERELLEAETTATEEALESLDGLAGDVDAGDHAVQRSRDELEVQLRSLESGEDDELDEDQQAAADYANLRLALVRRKRQVLLRLRDEKRIDDIVLRRIQSRLDLEEVRLAAED
ncbi:Na+/H+ antiporter [Amnibacterium soli]|uniref:Na+/H+ antiporter n=1 Tax=Amnibacterium soli TaxID=1282736 RepID=A0ABP8YY81_9MICO